MSSESWLIARAAQKQRDSKEQLFERMLPIPVHKGFNPAVPLLDRKQFRECLGDEVVAKNLQQQRLRHQTATCSQKTEISLAPAKPSPSEQSHSSRPGCLEAWPSASLPLEEVISFLAKGMTMSCRAYGINAYAICGEICGNTHTKMALKFLKTSSYLGKASLMNLSSTITT